MSSLSSTNKRFSVRTGSPVQPKKNSTDSKYDLVTPLLSALLLIEKPQFSLSKPFPFLSLDVLYE
ncbi:hypothetical protein M569_17751 [Genlisea aurea]|uniref:Uncharacterized protein n=1 Tax=Genlisea aurea TaxID=192259 RepID=S8BRN6_9LAMI|nr:hypothetical protein M569_17751 [Genlisea aurea]